MRERERERWGRRERQEEEKVDRLTWEQTGVALAGSAERLTIRITYGTFFEACVVVEAFG